MKETWTYIDLFAGTGAFSLALKRHRCVFANDMEQSSRDIYTLNYPDHLFVLGDLHTIPAEEIPPHNLLCAGFPCQPFSIAGNQQGFEDTRSNVFWKIIDILNCHMPDMILLENVKNLKSHDKGRTFQIMEQTLQEVGYYIKTAILDTNKMTPFPQHRERIYIVGFRDKTKCEAFQFHFPAPQERISLSNLLEKEVEDKYYYSNRFKVYDAIQQGVTKHISENVLYQYRRYYVRENKSNCCPTLTANMGGGGHNVPILKDDKGIRKLTPNECFRLQGFPIDYQLPSSASDSALYKLAGNAVSVPVVEAIVCLLERSV